MGHQRGALRRALRRTLLDILDGMGWRPLAGEHDYGEVELRIEREVFRAEFVELRRQGSRAPGARRG